MFECAIFHYQSLYFFPRGCSKMISSYFQNSLDPNNGCERDYFQKGVKAECNI